MPITWPLFQWVEVLMVFLFSLQVTRVRLPCVGKGGGHRRGCKLAALEATIETSGHAVGFRFLKIVCGGFKAPQSPKTR